MPANNSLLLDNVTIHLQPESPMIDNRLSTTGTDTTALTRSSSEGHTPGSSHTPLTTPSPNRSPRRFPTAPVHDNSTEELRLRIKKRIIICCDGTWQDGISAKNRSGYTNILRLARSINYEDTRCYPPVPQIVYYQSGIGTENNLYDTYIEGTTGGSLADKVEEAYAFIAHNYCPGDEIYLFGFSRGAYTARMVAMFVGEIGVLDRTDMDHFAGIFIAYQKLGKTNDANEKQKLREFLAPWTSHQSCGKLRADSDGDTFSVKCVGVFDTVGALGLPEELTPLTSSTRMLFGFPDMLLGEHVERAYQALALHERRSDFNCNKFHQTAGGIKKKQILKQCWFTGCHTDIGGGYPEHDLSDISFTWMAAHVGDILSLDMAYMSKLPQPVAIWGTQKPHDSATGIFSFAHTIPRELPSSTNNVTHEYIHPSVLEQAQLYPALEDLVKKHPELICPLLPLEEEMKVNWPYVPQSPIARSYTAHLDQQKPSSGFARSLSITGKRLSQIGKSLFRNGSVRRDTTIKTESGMPIYDARNSNEGTIIAGMPRIRANA